MNALTQLDLAALAVFLVAWFGYHAFIEWSPWGREGLTAVMNGHRMNWMRLMAERENRIVDAVVMQALTNGTAFFASTSLIAIGSCSAALSASRQAVEVFAELPFGLQTTQEAFVAKMLGLTLIFTYAFFKFAWSYRLFNYCAILIGATPLSRDADTPACRIAVERAGLMNASAGRHFNRGLRAFFFALGYLGWFVSGWALIVSTIAVLIVLVRRQLASDSLLAARQ